MFDTDFGNILTIIGFVGSFFAFSATALYTLWKKIAKIDERLSSLETRADNTDKDIDNNRDDSIRFFTRLEQRLDKIEEKFDKFIDAMINHFTKD